MVALSLVRQAWPLPFVISITADAGLSTSIDNYVLSYGCIYQGGFIYLVDDTTINSLSIGGKTAAVSDTFPYQASPPPGSPDWGAMGIDLGVNLYDTSFQGANDGSANTEDIINALTINYSSPPYSSSSPLPLTSYAAGLCRLVSVDASGASCTPPGICYTNWYLPAVCEMGPGPISAPCIPGNTNIQEQLFENTMIPSATLGIASGSAYWTSTEYTTNADIYSWYENFLTGASLQDGAPKSTPWGIRCSRTLIP